MSCTPPPPHLFLQCTCLFNSPRVWGTCHFGLVNLHRNGVFSGFGGISVVVHGNPICALWCKCIDYISGNAFSHVPCRSLRFVFFAVSAANVDHADTPSRDCCIFSQSDGTFVLAQIQGPSEHGADNQTTTYERSGDLVTHDCAPVVCMSLLHM